MSSAFFISLSRLQGSFASFESLLEKKPWEKSVDVNARYQGNLYQHIPWIQMKLQGYRKDIDALRESSRTLCHSGVDVESAVKNLNSLDAKVQKLAYEFIENCPSPSRRKILEVALGSPKQELSRVSDFQEKYVSLKESIDFLLSKDTLTLKEIYEYIAKIDVLDQKISEANSDHSRFLAPEADDTGKENSNILAIEEQRLDILYNLSKYRKTLENLYEIELLKDLNSKDTGNNEDETRFPTK